MPLQSLVQPLFDGPLDLVADVHGEIDALHALLRFLGYDKGGAHPQARRLVFLGDLTDRGPDSPAVVRLVANLLDRGRAQCVLGNHELNLLRGEHKHGNGWFYGQTETLDRSGHIVPQVTADDAVRAETLHLFGRLPLVLEREDLRVVHACWNAAAVEQARRAASALELLVHEEARIEGELLRQGADDELGRGLALQNGNPVKLLTSGPERQVAQAYWAAGKWRREARVPWWNDYQDDAWCVFGHYWRLRLPGEEAADHPFGRESLYAPLGNGRAMCLDYSVGKRWMERLAGAGPPYQTALAALRWPERELVFEDGRRLPLSGPS